MIAKGKYLFLQLVPLILIIACHQPAKYFTSVPPSQTHISFANNLEEKQDLGILSYIYYYNGGGVAIGDINNDGLPDIYFTANSRGITNYI